MNRSFESFCKNTCLLAVSALASLPVAVLAQDACNAQLTASTADTVFNINEPVEIVLDIGAGVVIDDDGINPPQPGFLDIFAFEYQLDCTPGDTYPVCNDAGNTITFDDSQVIATTCKGPGGIDIVLDPDYDDVAKIVTFTPVTDEPTPVPTSIRNTSEQTCEISFEVVVTELAGDNLNEEIVELTGWVNPSPEETFGLCSNNLVASAAASVSFDFSTNYVIFQVTKDFDPDLKVEQPVDVNIRCNAGRPLTNSFTITESTDVQFTVTFFEPGALDCEVWEEPVPAGFVPGYVAGRVSGVGDFDDDENGCYYTNVGNGFFTCDVTNTRAPGTFTANKVWEYDEEDLIIDIDENVLITIYCDSPILNGQETQPGIWTVSDTVIDGGSVTAELDPNGGTALCWAEEEFAQSDIVSSFDDCDVQKVPVGSEVECTFYNTVVFEGIPSLNNYGLALLALLMAGIGMVGFRRMI